MPTMLSPHPERLWLIVFAANVLAGIPSLVEAAEPTSPAVKSGEVITNSIGMKLARIPAGDFMMGAPKGEVDAGDVERPQHRVHISQPFYMGVYEVTQSEYQQVMNENPSTFKAVAGHDVARFPVERVTWLDAAKFCEKLSALPGEKAAGRVYKLPTEAQWEYACRAGTTTPFHFGSELNGEQANCKGTIPYGTYTKGKNLERPTTVGSYPSNAFGLYDMHGNVREWCADAWDENYYAKSPEVDPSGPETSEGADRVLRGGCWYEDAYFQRAAKRLRNSPGGTPLNTIGLRVVAQDFKSW